MCGINKGNLEKQKCNWFNNFNVVYFNAKTYHSVSFEHSQLAKTSGALCTNEKNQLPSLYVLSLRWEKTKIFDRSRSVLFGFGFLRISISLALFEFSHIIKLS